MLGVFECAVQRKYELECLWFFSVKLKSSLYSRISTSGYCVDFGVF